MWVWHQLASGSDTIQIDDVVREEDPDSFVLCKLETGNV